MNTNLPPVLRGKYGKYLWQPCHEEFIRQNWEACTNSQLAEALGVKLTKLREKVYEMGLKRLDLHQWTHEEVQFIRDNYHERGDTELAQILEETSPQANKPWSKKHICKKRRYLGLLRTREQVSHIKTRNAALGMFAICPVKAWETRGTAAKEGDIKVWNNRAVIKTCCGWVTYNRWLYERHIGQLPSDLLVVTRSGSTIATGPEDLMVIDRDQHARRNYDMALPAHREIRKLVKKMNTIINQYT